MDEFKNIILEIKKHINNTKIEIFQNANNSLLKLYYTIGSIIDNNSKWGNKFINKLSQELKIAYPNIKGFSVRNLKNMKKYYKICSKNKKVQTASAQIPWSHNILILDKVKNDNERLWYIEETSLNGWSYDVLAFQIKSNLYSRQMLNEKVNNFTKTLHYPQRDLANHMMKDPYILDITGLHEQFIEKELERKMVDKIKTILLLMLFSLNRLNNIYCFFSFLFLNT